MTTSDPLAPFRASASPEQRADADAVDLAPEDLAEAELLAEITETLALTRGEQRRLGSLSKKLAAEVRRLREEATRPAPRSPEEEEAMDIIRRAAESLRAKEPAADDLTAIETAAREDKAVASRATARPWKWWTANSMRELRSEAGRRSYPVAHGQQHPHDRVIDIAIQEPDMALIERAVNGLEERADALLRLVKVVRRAREREADDVLVEIDGHVRRLIAGGRGELSDLLAVMQRAKACIEAVFTARNSTLRRDLLMKCAVWAIAAIREIDRAEALVAGEPPRAGEESGDG